MRFAAYAENRRTKGQKNKRYNACVSPLSAENISNISLSAPLVIFRLRGAERY